MSDNPDAQKDKGRPLPKSEDVLNSLAGASANHPEASTRSEQKFVKRTEEQAIEAQVRYEHLKGVRDHYRHKGNWSKFLMLAVGGMLVYQSILLVLVGFGWMDFKDYEWLLPALLVQNLGQVIGLAVYAVKYLFSDISDQGQS